MKNKILQNIYPMLCILTFSMCITNVVAADKKKECSIVDDCQWQTGDKAKIIENTHTKITHFGTCSFSPPLTCSEKPSRYPPGYIPIFYRGVMEYQQCGTTNKCGKAFDINQKTYITNWIKQENGPIFVVVYVHGWHHNARAENTWETENNDDGNFTKFNDLLARVSHQLRYKTQILNSNKPVTNYKTLGIYIGWQGQSETNAIRNFFSIGNGAAAADTIAFGINPRDKDYENKENNSNLHEDLKEISDLLNKNTDNRLLIIGHSLGGELSQIYF